jgi:hypothetical protein
MVLNISIPHFYAKIRTEHLYQQDGRGGFEEAVIFGAQSVGGKALTFHVMTEEGAVRSRVPIHMLSWKDPSDKKPLDYLQLWDCFGESVTVTTYEYLAQSRVQVVFKDGTKEWGNYMMTFDWYNNPYSQEPTQYKAAHLIKLDDGNFALQPNNRLVWKDMSFTTKPFPDKPDWKVDNKDWVCESVSDRWIIHHENDNYYYSVKNIDLSNK